jgi:hypothetical protein
VAYLTATREAGGAAMLKVVGYALQLAALFTCIWLLLAEGPATLKGPIRDATSPALLVQALK